MKYQLNFILPEQLISLKNEVEEQGYEYVGASLEDCIMVFRRVGTTRLRVVNFSLKPSLTDQTSKDECDINRIIARHASAGVPLPSNNNSYHDFSNMPSFHEYVHLKHVALENFANLPDNVRETFNNDPNQFLEEYYNSEYRQRNIDIGIHSSVDGGDSNLSDNSSGVSKNNLPSDENLSKSETVKTKD